jgi:hypothetical protein
VVGPGRSNTSGLVPFLPDIYAGLTSAGRERLYALCAQIVEEKESTKFQELVHELTDLLDRQEHRPDDPIREMCAKAIRADSGELEPFLTQLREILHTERKRLGEAPLQKRRSA